MLFKTRIDNGVLGEQQKRATRGKSASLAAKPGEAIMSGCLDRTRCAASVRNRPVEENLRLRAGKLQKPVNEENKSQKKSHSGRVKTWRNSGTWHLGAWGLVILGTAKAPQPWHTRTHTHTHARASVKDGKSPDSTGATGAMPRECIDLNRHHSWRRVHSTPMNPCH